MLNYLIKFGQKEFKTNDIEVIKKGLFENFLTEVFDQIEIEDKKYGEKLVYVIAEIENRLFRSEMLYTTQDGYDKLNFNWDSIEEVIRTKIEKTIEVVEYIPI